MPIPEGQSDEFNTGFASGLGMTVQALAVRQRGAGMGFDIPAIRDSMFPGQRRRWQARESEWCKGYVAGIERGFELTGNLWERGGAMLIPVGYEPTPSTDDSEG